MRVKHFLNFVVLLSAFVTLSASSFADTYYGVFHLTGTTKSLLGALVAGGGNGVTYNFANGASPSAQFGNTITHVESVELDAPFTAITNTTPTMATSLANLYKAVSGAYYVPAQDGVASAAQPIVGEVNGVKGVTVGSFTISAHYGTIGGYTGYFYTLVWTAN